jgi:hypothetical protein
MTKLPVQASPRAVRKVRKNAVESVSPRGDSFLSFRYSYTEISATGPTAHVKSRSARYENGKLAAESFEGSVDRSAYDRLIGETQRRIAEQTALMLRSFFPFVALPGKTHPEDD